jgi:hypothetical protein
MGLIEHLRSESENTEALERESSNLQWIPPRGASSASKTAKLLPTKRISVFPSAETEDGDMDVAIGHSETATFPGKLMH